MSISELRRGTAVTATALALMACDDFPDHGPDPELFVEPTGLVSGVFAGGNHLFWVDRVGLHRIPFEGGTAELVATPGNGMTDQDKLRSGPGVVADDFIYWFVMGDLYRVRGPGQTAELVYTNESLNVPTEIAAGGSTVVWVTSTNDDTYFIHNTDWDGAAAQMDHEVRAVAFHEGEVYFGDWEQGTSGAIRRLVVGQPAVVTTGNNPVHIKLDESSIYWIEEQEDESNSPPKRLMKAPKSGGTGTVIGDLGSCADQLGGDDPWFDLYDGYAYFLGELSVEEDECRASSGVVRVPLVGGAPEYVMTRDDIQSPKWLRVGGDYAFFVHGIVDQSIFRIPL